MLRRTLSLSIYFSTSLLQNVTDRTKIATTKSKVAELLKIIKVYSHLYKSTLKTTKVNLNKLVDDEDDTDSYLRQFFFTDKGGITVFQSDYNSPRDQL